LREIRKEYLCKITNIFVFTSGLLCFISAFADQPGLICFDFLRQDTALTLCCELDAVQCVKFQRGDWSMVFLVDVEWEYPVLC